MVAAAPGQLTWGLMLAGGLMLGAFCSSMISGDFKLRLPRQKSVYPRVLLGGVLMGYGAGLASGCTVGGFFSAVPSLGLNGWVFGSCVLGGALLGLQIIKKVG
ncbi:MAG: YeeE/YedE family protein [Dehalococcoidia bacterium]|nr:YeeE/YedE family protein [Dehalococcoidia bacterium]